ncbi:hypothetical protein JFL43_07460 [Viridibacillus sp. YIM B01967]|uniref:Uncharacterized protein n=1 Tax=Viridibacillus soli TaxID=2798301 RepID=A0ABS1H5N1_9BACL|nr:hypothetical protein [Viridibacillus soli]MBK3494696.1 hypothetical protein [Viridibacillus soli]
MDILERATKRKQIAVEILTELNLMDSWREIGDPYIVGATAYNLIVEPDIDIETFSANPRPNQALKFLSSLSNNPKVIEIKYHNYLDSQYNGFYFKLLYRHESAEIWNIDMWLFPLERQGALSRDLVQEMANTLTEEQRIAILSIKEDLLKQDHEYPSIYIYQSVLEYNIKNIKSFLNWMEKQEVDKQLDWKPHFNKA